MNKYDAVVFVSLDTLRADAIGACPWKLWPKKYDVARAPATRGLDALVERSAFLSHCISSAPYTSASHATYFTGKWPLRHGVYEFFNRPLASDTIFTDARKLGYRTLFKVDFPIILGKFLGFTRDADEYIVEDDDAFLSSLSRPGPVMAFVHFGGIHIPYGFHNLMFGGDDYRAKVAELEREVDLREEPPGDQLVETFRSAEDLAILIRYKRVVQELYGSRNYNRLFELYLEGVDYFMRRRFDPFLEKLQGLLEGRRHLLVVFGDHGEEYDDESYGHFNSAAEGVLRVPVLISGADVTPSVHLERARTVDIAPTVLEAIGAPAERIRALDGTSMAPTIFGGAAYTPRDSVAQSYISLASEFVAYQKELLARGERPGQLRHVRYREAAYSGRDKLVRQTHTYVLEGNDWALRRCPARIALERLMPDMTREPFADAERSSALLEQLDRYNLIQVESARGPVEVTAGIRSELQSMGYRV